MGERKKLIEWATPARRDFLQVIKYLMSKNPSAAVRFADGVDRKLQQIARFPDSGRPIPEDATSEPDPTRREVMVMRWRIGYSISDRIQVLYVIHGARLFPPDS